MKPSCFGALTAVLLATLAATGCGLKGALTMPSKSEEVVIRTPAQVTPTEGATTTTPAAPAEPLQEAPAKKPPRDERIPPPPLPGAGG
jgi:predicted small lipoprotein YifL